MEQAATLLCGTHDYRAFCSLKKFKKSTVRTIEKIEIGKMGQEIRISYTGDGFLYHMVRILTGTLVEVGLGLRKPEEMTEILEGQDRTKAGRLMPPEGLTLESVDREGAIKDEKHRSEIQRVHTDFKRRTGTGNGMYRADCTGLCGGSSEKDTGSTAG